MTPELSRTVQRSRARRSLSSLLLAGTALCSAVALSAAAGWQSAPMFLRVKSLGSIWRRQRLRGAIASVSAVRRRSIARLPSRIGRPRSARRLRGTRPAAFLPEETHPEEHRVAASRAAEPSAADCLAAGQARAKARAAALAPAGAPAPAPLAEAAWSRSVWAAVMAQRQAAWSIPGSALATTAPAAVSWVPALPPAATAVQAVWWAPAQVRAMAAAPVDSSAPVLLPVIAAEMED